MQNYVENVFHFFSFRQEKPFFDKSGQKDKNCQLKLRFRIKTKLIMRNLMMMFTFSV